MNKSFTMIAGNTKSLEKAVNRLNRHSKKMGYGEVSVVSVSKSYEKRRTILFKSEDGEVSEDSAVYLVVDVVVDMPEQFLNPVAAEWKVLGVVTKVDDQAEVISGEVNMVEVSKAADGFGWRCQSSGCNRPIKNAYVVKSISGEIRLVGSECLKQFTGADGAAIISAIEFVTCLEIKEGDSEGGRGSGSQSLHSIDLEDYMAACLAIVRRDGSYVKRWIDDGYGDKKESFNCTRNNALAQFVGQFYMDSGVAMRNLNGINFKVVEVTEDDRNASVSLIESWQKSEVLPRNDGSEDDYAAQCKVISERGWITEKSAGIAASMVKGPRKPEVKKDYSNAQHIGSVGERLVFKDLVVLMAIPKVTEWGTTIITKMETPEGNLITWFSTSGHGYQKGEKISLKGTVKAHSEYKGIKETIINRAEEYSEEAEEAKKQAKKVAAKAKRDAKKVEVAA